MNVRPPRRILIAVAVLLCFPLTWRAQTPPPEKAAPKPPTEDGIPVTSQLAIDKCSPCHKKDDKSNLTRISWERTTPEGWQQVIRRMVRLNGLQLSPEDARAIVKYLSNSHGLAPEEAKPALYIAERRMLDETLPNDSIREACVICHAAGRAMSWRRTKEEWELLLTMHVGYFPLAEFQGFRRGPRNPNAPPPAPGTDTRDPGDRAVEFLAKTYPLHTPEWAAWRAGMRPVRLAGRWLVTASEPGRGRIFGEMTIEPTAQADEFTTSTRLFYLQDGKTVARTGRSLVYTGYAWRGRSQSKESGEPEAREVMLLSRDQSQMEGRWFWGGYDEFGIDVTLRRAGNDPVVLGTNVTALQAGSSAQRLVIYCYNLPTDLKPDELDLGSGVTVKRIVNQTPGTLTVEVDIAAGAVAGKRDVAVRRSVSTAAFAVYDKIDYLKVFPEAAMARLGGAGHPKGFQQFEARGYHRGVDNKPNTPDDIDLGAADVTWSVEEFLATYGDDDKDFVGVLSTTGLFTPAMEGPNPKRKHGQNNFGDVWVVATHKDPKAGRDGKPASGRAHLVVTIPLYVRWDTPEVSQ